MDRNLLPMLQLDSLNPELGSIAYSFHYYIHSLSEYPYPVPPVGKMSYFLRYF
jgi:hypothetical protein